jgi:hypothetical protein
MSNNKSILSILFAGLVLLGIVACEKGINDEIITPPANVEFATLTSTPLSYFIRSQPNTGIKLPVGFTNVLDKDRTITLTYTSPTGAVRGTHYNAPESITIPAGKAADSLLIEGVFDSYTSTRKDTLKISVSSPDAPTANANNTYTVILRKYCDVNPSSFLGAYTQSTNGSGTYTITVDEAVATGPTSGYIIISGLYNGTSAPVRVNLDWSNPSNFTTTVVETQNIYNHATYGPVAVRPVGKGSFSSCANTFTLSYQRYVSAGNFAANTTVMAR